MPHVAKHPAGRSISIILAGVLMLVSDIESVDDPANTRAPG